MGMSYLLGQTSYATARALEANTVAGPLGAARLRGFCVGLKALGLRSAGGTHA